MSTSILQTISPIPIGAVIAWYGTLSDNFDSSGRGINKMTGWALCNSKNGTPELQDRFIIGAGHTYAPEQTGGKVSTSLSVSQLPAHKHTVQAIGNHTHQVTTNVSYSNIWFAAVSNGSGNLAISGVYSVTSDPDGGHTHVMDDTGNGDPVEILPPFYALYYIMRIE